RSPSVGGRHSVHLTAAALSPAFAPPGERTAAAAAAASAWAPRRLSLQARLQIPGGLAPELRQTPARSSSGFRALEPALSSAPWRWAVAKPGSPPRAAAALPELAVTILPSSYRLGTA